MIRTDIIRQTSHVRDLLVARSLYASCIEPEREEAGEDEETEPDWREDQNRIFSSWESEM